MKEGEVAETQLGISAPREGAPSMGRGGGGGAAGGYQDLCVTSTAGPE